MSHVQVAMRIKPSTAENTQYLTALDETGTLMLNKPESSGEMYSFQYTNVLDSVDNQTTYERVGRPVVDYVMQGYNGTVMAYGQTGSGKTYTMLGPDGAIAEHNRGIMPRALDDLFTALRSRAGILEWSVSVTYTEVYMEQIRDLLVAPPARSAAAARNKAPAIDVKDVRGVVHLSNVSPIKVENMDDVMQLVERAQATRAQAAHKLNDRSSRSHTVLTVWVSTTVTEAGKTSTFSSKLNLVDLAGSERRKATGTTGLAAEEGNKINQSLLNLQTVVMALSKGGAVPSYRSSKLTHMLKDSLGGNCKTVLVACCWGDPEFFSETLSTCRFAERMMKVKVSAQKMGGVNSVHGNLMKLDPAVMAMMEKRVAAQVALEKAKLLEQYKQYGIPSDGAADNQLSESQQQELELLRSKVAELETQRTELANPKPVLELRGAAQATESTSIPANMLEEMERLRRELEQAKGDAEQAKQMQTRSSDGAGVPEDMAAYQKLRQLAPQHAELLERQQAGPGLSAEEHETLLFLSDEIHRLNDILQRHGVLQTGGSRNAEHRALESDGTAESLSPTLGEFADAAGSRAGWSYGPSPHYDPLHGHPTRSCPTSPTTPFIGVRPRPTTPDPYTSLPPELEAQACRAGFWGGRRRKTDALSAQKMRQQQDLQRNLQENLVFLSPLNHRDVVEVLDERSAFSLDVPFDLEKIPVPESVRRLGRPPAEE